MNNKNSQTLNNIPPQQTQTNVQRFTFGKVVPDHRDPSSFRPINLALQNRRFPRSSSTPSHKKLRYSSNAVSQVDSAVSFLVKHPFRIKNLNNFLGIETMDNFKFVALSTSNFKPRYNFTASTILLRRFNNSTKQFLWENSIAIFGGRSSQNVPPKEQISKAELILYNISSNTWSSLNFITEEPILRYSHATISHNGSLYVFGGTNGIKFNNDFLIISIATAHCACAKISGIRNSSEKWPSARCSHTLTKIETDKDEKKNNKDETFKAYMFGGIESSGLLSGDLWEVTCVNGTTPKWRLISQNGPPPRYNHIAFVKDGKFHVAGGYDQNGKPLNDIWMFDETKVEKTQTEVKKTQPSQSPSPSPQQPHSRSRTISPSEASSHQMLQSARNTISPMNNAMSQSLYIPDPSQRPRSIKTTADLGHVFPGSGSENDLNAETRRNMSGSSSLNQFDQLDSNEFESNNLNNGWTQLAVFDPDPTVFGLNGNLYSIQSPDNSIIQIKEKRTLALLDDKFSQHFKFKSFNNKYMKKEGELDINSMYSQKLYEFQELEYINKNLSSPQVSPTENRAITDASNYFSPNKVSILSGQIAQMRKDFVQKSLIILRNHIDTFCCEKEECNNFTEKFLHEKMDELNLLTNIYQNRCNDVKMELELSQQLLNSLNGLNPTNIEDPGYKASIEYAKALIELDTKKQKILRLNAKIKKSEEKSGIKLQKINETIKNTALAEAIYKQEVGKMNKWDKYVQHSLEQLQVADATIETLQTKASDTSLQAKVNEVAKAYNDMRENYYGKERNDALKNIEGALKMIKNSIPFEIVKGQIADFYSSFSKKPLPSIVDLSQQRADTIKLCLSKYYQDIQLPTSQHPITGQQTLQQPTTGQLTPKQPMTGQSIPQQPNTSHFTQQQQNQLNNQTAGNRPISQQYNQQPLQPHQNPPLNPQQPRKPFQGPQQIPGVRFNPNQGQQISTNPQLPNQQLPNRQLPNQQIPNQHIPNQQIPNQKLPNQKLPNQQIPNQQFPNQKLPNQQIPNRQLPNQQIPNQQIPNQQIPNQQIPNQQIPNQQIPNRQLPNQQLPNQLISNQQIPNQQTPNQQPQARQRQTLPGQPGVPNIQHRQTLPNQNPGAPQGFIRQTQTGQQPMQRPGQPLQPAQIGQQPPGQPLRPAQIGQQPLQPAQIGQQPLRPAQIGQQPPGQPAQIGQQPIQPAPIGQQPLQPAPIGQQPLQPAPIGQQPPGQPLRPAQIGQPAPGQPFQQMPGPGRPLQPGQPVRMAQNTQQISPRAQHGGLPGHPNINPAQRMSQQPGQPLIPQQQQSFFQQQQQQQKPPQ